MKLCSLSCNRVCANIEQTYISSSLHSSTRRTRHFTNTYKPAALPHYNDQTKHKSVTISVSLINVRSKFAKCGERSYLTNSAGNGDSQSSTLTYENIFNEWNKVRVKERLATVKLVELPTQFATNNREAAVLVPLCKVKGEPSLLYMKRSLHLRNHAGDVCFPGGVQDIRDNSLVATALRETHEEMGLDGTTLDIWGAGCSEPSRVSIKKGHMVTPIIGYCGEVDVARLTPNKNEVDSVFSVPISTFFKTENQHQTQFRYPGGKGFTLPVFTGGEHTIWGLTAIFTHQILTLLAPGMYKFKLRHRH